MEAPHRPLEAAAIDDGLALFVNVRSRILATAYRTLGSATEAEDVAQDVWLRWQNADRGIVHDAGAFLTTTTRRLALNRVLRARTHYETPLELRLVEPIDPNPGPGMLTERCQALESALRRLLEKLSPMERAAYLLREAFNYSYRRIAEVVGVSEANGRQLVTRARKRLTDEHRVPVGASEVQRITVAFVRATRSGDLAGLEAILVTDIVDSVAKASRGATSASRRRSRPLAKTAARSATSRSLATGLGNRERRDGLRIP